MLMLSFAKTMKPIFILVSALCAVGILECHAASVVQSGSVVQWGSSVLPSIEPQTRFGAISSGYEAAFAITRGRVLQGWRWNTYGEIPPASQATDIIAVAADSHTLVLKADGTVLAWGEDDDGQTDVPPGLSNVVAISASYGQSLALKSDGTIAAWGWNQYGGVSNWVPSGLNNVIAIAAGKSTTLALKSDRTVFYIGRYTNCVIAGLSNIVSIAGDPMSLGGGAWEVDAGGNLIYTHVVGSGVFTNNYIPGLTNVVGISGGGDNKLALLSDGTVMRVNSTLDGAKPLACGAIAVAANNAGLFALTRDGNILQFDSATNSIPRQPPWDYTRNITNLPMGGGDLISEPDGTAYCLSCGVQSPFSGWSNIVATATGFGFALALTTSGTVVAQGDDSDGECDVPPGLNSIVAIAAGGYHSLALKSDGTVMGWGYDAYGQASGSPVASAAAISAGALHSLALMSNGTVQAWGYNYQGQCNVPSGLNNVIAIAAGGAHNLALKSNGTVVAWGYNNEGQINVPAGLSNVVAIAAGGDHSLALKSDGTVLAWGSNDYGESTVPNGLGPVIAISAGSADSMALVLPTVPTLQELLSPDGVVVSWPSVYSGFRIQYSDNLGSGWADWPDPPASLVSNFWITNPISKGSRFFRLSK